MKFAFQAVFMAFLLASCIVDEHGSEASQAEGSIVKVGDRLPAFTVDVVSGDGRHTFSSNSLTGTTVIIFFHTGCSDCQRELPRLDAYYLAHRAEPGFQMVAIAREEQEDEIAAYWREHRLSIPYSPQEDRRIYSLFALLSIPRVYISTAEGIVSWIGVENFEMPNF